MGPGRLLGVRMVARRAVCRVGEVARPDAAGDGDRARESRVGEIGPRKGALPQNARACLAQARDRGLGRLDGQELVERPIADGPGDGDLAECPTPSEVVLGL